MSVFRLTEKLLFPDPALAEPDGLLAIGGDLSSERLVMAYSMGIFPWFSRGYPIMWWSPDPRLVLFPEKFKITASLRQVLKKSKYEVTINKSFPEVISLCAGVPREGQPGTWITGGMKKAYTRLHKQGLAHSVESWHEGKLVGGLYGLSLGRAFFGESMFHLMTDASKVALHVLVEHAKTCGMLFIDAQLRTEHLVSLGAEEISREKYLQLLSEALKPGGQQQTYGWPRPYC